MPPSITAVILAAGKGTRMKSGKAKVLHEVFFKPMVQHVLDNVNRLAVTQCALIIGHQKEKVLQSLKQYSVTPVIQEEQLGTGHAVLCAEQECKDADHVLILCGDTPLLKSETLEAFIQDHFSSQADITLLTTTLDDPFGYGRIIKNDNGRIESIVEQKDASPKQQEIQEINGGVYIVSRQFLFSALQKVGTDNSQGEVYLTDIISIAAEEGRIIQAFNHPVPIDVLGVNSRVELAQAHHELQMRHNRTLMLSGITMLSPQTALIEPSVSITGDALIYGGVQITGNSTIENDCTLANGVVLHNCILQSGVSVGANAVLENCTIKKNEYVPPLLHRIN